MKILYVEAELLRTDSDCWRGSHDETNSRFSEFCERA